MMDWKPRVRAGLRWESLPLTAEEGFLLSRMDGMTSVQGLQQVTGLSQGQLRAMLAKLSATGAIEPAPVATALEPTSAPAIVNGTAVARRAPVTVEVMPDGASDALAGLHDDQELIEAVLASLNLDDSLEGDPTDEGDAVLDDDDEPGRSIVAATSVHDDRGDAAPVGEGAEADAVAADDSDVLAAEAEDSAVDVEEGNYRKLFETRLHPLPPEEREALARTAIGSTAMALCFDPVPQVIARLMENSEVGFPHARLIARYHRTPQGLDAIFKRSEFPRDTQVQRYLLSNPMLSEPQLKRVLQPKPLVQVYKWALSRELPETNRIKVRQLLRSKWGVSDGEERANLVWSTEGRCLQYLVGLQLDSKATTLLCQRSIHSVMMIQSLARFTATPPPLLAHLARQPVVKRQPNLKTMIMQHPNCPSELKRKKP